jgi:hypothetical protein
MHFMVANRGKICESDILPTSFTYILCLHSLHPFRRLKSIWFCLGFTVSFYAFRILIDGVYCCSMFDKSFMAYAIRRKGSEIGGLFSFGISFPLWIKNPRKLVRLESMKDVLCLKDLS